ncbi:hypothetical protein LXL04_008336 [Taraxacum kok-saghyz]
MLISNSWIKSNEATETTKRVEYLFGMQLGLKLKLAGGQIGIRRCTNRSKMRIKDQNSPEEASNTPRSCRIDRIPERGRRSIAEIEGNGLYKLSTCCRRWTNWTSSGCRPAEVASRQMTERGRLQGRRVRAGLIRFQKEGDDRLLKLKVTGCEKYSRTHQ